MTSQIRTEFYEVEGRTQRRLQRNIRNLGPNGYHAMTRYEWRMAYQFQQFDQGCELQNIEIEIDINVLYPMWVDKETASRSLRDSWVRQQNSLEQHENGHVAIAWLGAVRTLDRLRTTRAMSKCFETRDEVEAMNARSDETNRALHTDYDRITNHGQRQEDWDWTPLLAEEPRLVSILGLD